MSVKLWIFWNLACCMVAGIAMRLSDDWVALYVVYLAGLLVGKASIARPSKATGNMP